MSGGVDVRDGVDTFIAKWRARGPEWELARVFVPEPRRDHMNGDAVREQP